MVTNGPEAIDGPKEKRSALPASFKTKSRLSPHESKKERGLGRRLTSSLRISPKNVRESHDEELSSPRARGEREKGRERKDKGKEKEEKSFEFHVPETAEIFNSLESFYIDTEASFKEYSDPINVDLVKPTPKAEESEYEISFSYAGELDYDNDDYLFRVRQELEGLITPGGDLYSDYDVPSLPINAGISGSFFIGNVKNDTGE